MAFVCPTITLTDTSALEERLALAKHYHVDTILSSSEKGNRHMGMIAGNDDSLVILRKLKAGEIAGDTRVIVLDRMPRDEVSAKVVCRLLQDMGRSEGALDNRIGEVFYWSREWIEAGLWCPTVLRKRELVEAALRYAGGMEGKLARLADQGASNDGGGARHQSTQLRGGVAKAWATKQTLNNLYSKFKADVYYGNMESEYAPEKTEEKIRGDSQKTTKKNYKVFRMKAFDVIDSAGGNGQRYIEAVPDEKWCGESKSLPPILEKAGYLLITAAQGVDSARLTAVASDTKYIGNHWLPVTGMTPDQAKAAAVFINSTMGRLQLLIKPSRMPAFPQYSADVASDLMLPDLTDDGVVSVLRDVWEATRRIEVGLFREGECEARQLWDAGVAEVLEMDVAVLDAQRMMLHREPLVSGRNYGDVLVE